MSMPLPVPSSLPIANPSSNGARLVAADGRELPLRSVSLQSQAGGGLAATVVRQVFANPFAEPLSLTYQLPLPADGAVIDFAFTLGERRIQGRVERKADARASFEQAVFEGRTAALLEQDRSSLFTQELGNVPPGAEIVCEITVEHLLQWRQGGWEWRFPTVVAPRFLGTPGQTPDAARVSTDVLDGPAPVRCALSLKIADRCTTAPLSPSHIVHFGGQAWELGAEAQLDRDVVVRWSSSERTVVPAVEVCHPEGSARAYAMLHLVPPVPEALPQPVARDLILLLDTSGSMHGRPMDQLKAFCRALIRTLGPRDQLEMIAFSSSQERWKGSATSVTPRSATEALAWIDGLHAGGGTYMHEAIIAALQPLRTDSQRQVVLVSDGLIGFEQQVIGAIRNQLPTGSRVHTIGVGSGVNRSLTGPCARAGAGLELVVGLDEAVEPAVVELLARTDAPIVVDLGLRGSVLKEVAPMRVPDLFANAPTRIWIEVDPAGGPLEVTGRTAAGPYKAVVQIPSANTGSRAVATRFARERIEDLELELAAGADSTAIDAAIESLGLFHRIATRMTSWVAETTEATVDPSDPTRRVAVPQSLPYGMSAEGVGLRAIAAPMHTNVYAAAGAAPPPAPMSMPAPARSRAMAPKGKRMMETQKKSTGLFERAAAAFDGMFGAGGASPMGDAEEAEPVEASREVRDDRTAIVSGPAVLVRATVRSHRDGTIVLELEIPIPTDWKAGDHVQIELADGSLHTVEVRTGTTKPGAVSAGVTVRLVLAWAGATPIRVQVSGLVAEVR